MSPTATAAVAPRTAAARPRCRRFGINLASNIAQLGLTMVIGAWYVPYLVSNLGPAAYGLIPLASSITAYMSLITFGLNSAVGRSLTIALEREDHAKANLVFNVSLWGSLVLCALLLLPAIATVVHVQHLLRIPPGYETATRWLFVGTIAAFLLNQLKTPFGVPCFSRNRLDLENLVVICETLTRVGLVVCLFALFTPRIEFVGAGILAGTVVSTVGMVWLWRLLTPTLRVRLRDFDWGMLKSLCGTGGWVIISQIGVILYLNIDLLVANRLFGAEPTGRYAAVLQLPALLRSVCIAVGGIFAPTMFHIFAGGDMKELVAYLNRAIKFVGLVIALPIGLVCGFGEPLLRLWLGPSFGSLAPLLFLMAIHLCINLAVYPLYAVPLAANRVKIPGLVTLGIGFANLLLALFLAGYLDWGLYGLAAAGGITLTVRHLLFTPMYGARILKQPYKTFYREILPVVLATGAVVGVCRLILTNWSIVSWAGLAAASLGVSLLYAALVYFLLSPEERVALKGFIQQRRGGNQPAS
ncbi:MAG TPA: lipopolysaccharide biosynthesis protein [Candidatus Paceibacterota bacterium]|nr:lipopolysaccharide biosynthesis protein [Verrucomicrobiota bacterium]HSA08814.1 lipopolysaccharide biosynthesis protein [Candidatus Paceibacterota bacterium]